MPDQLQAARFTSKGARAIQQYSDLLSSDFSLGFRYKENKVSRSQSSSRQARKPKQGHFARARQVHSVFEDAGCDVTSHHRCARVAPICWCDPTLGSEAPHECACGHTHVRPTLSGAREPDLLIETAPPGVL